MGSGPVGFSFLAYNEISHQVSVNLLFIGVDVLEGAQVDGGAVVGRWWAA